MIEDRDYTGVPVLGQTLAVGVARTARSQPVPGMQPQLKLPDLLRRRSVGLPPVDTMNTV